MRSDAPHLYLTLLRPRDVRRGDTYWLPAGAQQVLLRGVGESPSASCRTPKGVMSHAIGPAALRDPAGVGLPSSCGGARPGADSSGGALPCPGVRPPDSASSSGGADDPMSSSPSDRAGYIKYAWYEEADEFEEGRAVNQS